MVSLTSLKPLACDPEKLQILEILIQTKYTQ